MLFWFFTLHYQQLTMCSRDFRSIEATNYFLWKLTASSQHLKNNFLFHPISKENWNMKISAWVSHQFSWRFSFHLKKSQKFHRKINKITIFNHNVHRTNVSFIKIIFPAVLISSISGLISNFIYISSLSFQFYFLAIQLVCK